MTKVYKLAKKLKDLDLAQVLVEAGLDSPAKIRAASDKDLQAVEGVGKVKVSKIREKIRGR